jgi:hypothetical protein
MFKALSKEKKLVKMRDGDPTKHGVTGGMLHRNHREGIGCRKEVGCADLSDAPRETTAEGSKAGMQNPSPLNNLCQAFHLVQGAPGTCFGAVEDSPGALYLLHHVEPKEVPQKSQSMVSLAQVMSRKTDRYQSGESRQMYAQDRLELAIRLSTAVLQLYDSPWLATNWSNRDIFVLQKDQDVDRLALTQPYVRGSFAGNEPQGIPPSTWMPIRNPTLFALGVILIELYYNRPLSSLQIDQDRPQGPAASLDDQARFVTAYRVLEKRLKSDAFGWEIEYANVVRRCLYCPFDLQETTFEKDDFLNAVYANVVISLKSILKRNSS